MQQFQFVGTPSGDYESFCWDVDFDTYVLIKGEEPGQYDRSINFEDYTGKDFYRNDNMYRIYPNDLFKSKKKLIITITIEDQI